jgi:diphthamide biosynthesis protein 7
MQISTTPTPYAILDIHFSPHDPTLLAIATSTGLIELYNLSLNITLSNSTSKIKTSTEASLTYLSTHKPLGLETTPTLILSLSWHPALPSKLAITVSTGQVYLIDTEEAKDGSKKELLVHDLEAWTVAFARQGDGLFSGGDDAALRFTGLPVPDACDSAIKDHKTSLDDGQEDEEEEEEYLPNWSDTRAHTAGVTAILPLLPLPLTHHHHHHAKTVKNNNIIITGSYDDNIRILHTPLQGRKRVLAEENLQGGVWRLNMLCEHVEDGRYVFFC